MNKTEQPDFGPVLNQVVATHGDRPFLVHAATGETWTYGEFLRLAGRLASLLRDHGLLAGDRCLLIMDNSPVFAALYWSCLGLGVAAVPINPALHPDDIAYCLRHARAKLLLSSPAHQAVLPPEEATPNLARIVVDEGLTARISAFDDFFAGKMPAIPADRLFAVTFTSGTTGVPKGVMHPASSLIGAARAYGQAFGFRPEHRFHHVLPMTYMAGFLNLLLCPFMAGASVVLDRPFDARMAISFWQVPIRHGVNIAWLVPTMLATLLRIDRDPAGAAYCRHHIPHFCVATAPLGLRLKQDFEQKYGTRLHESYGLSEILFVATNAPDLPFREGSVGKPLAGVEVAIRNDAGANCSLAEEGEVCVRGPFGMSGYLDPATGRHDPDSMPEFFPTGDIGRLDDVGYLYITGRKKDLIVRGGLNVSPRAVEEVLHALPAVAEAAVVGLPHDFYGEEVVAAVVWREGVEIPPAAEVMAFCRRRLSPTAVPARLVAMAELPHGSTGKVLKRRLQEMLLEGKA